MSENEYNETLKKLDKPPVTVKTATHLLAITLPEKTWQQLTPDKLPDYLTEANITAWTLSAYVERHLAVGDLLTVMFDKDEAIDPNVSTLVIQFANLLNAVSVDTLDRISLDTLQYCRLLCCTLLESPQYANSEYLNKLLDMCDKIMVKRYEVIAQIVNKHIGQAFPGVGHE